MDLVVTRDQAPRPLRRTGRRALPDFREHAPVCFAAGTPGSHQALLLSPQRRVLIHDPLTEPLFARVEGLVATKELINGHPIAVQKAAWWIKCI